MQRLTQQWGASSLEEEEGKSATGGKVEEEKEERRTGVSPSQKEGKARS